MRVQAPVPRSEPVVSEGGALISERRTTLEAYSYSGPVPHPDIAAGWERELPGAAERLMRMAEKQSSHRIDIERTVVRGRTLSSVVGTFGAILIALSLIGVGGYLLAQDKEITGLATLGGTMATFVWAYRRETAPPKKK